MSKNKKKEKWVKRRHQVVMKFLRFIFKPFLYFKIGYTYKKCTEHKTPALIIYNHQTAWDQFMIGLIVNPKTYFVMTDDIETMPLLAKILKFLLHPIPYKKASTDFTILRNLKQVASEGGSICISVEGNRTFSGKTEYINPTACKMVKFLKLPLMIINLTGGYGAFPRWSDKSRKGKAHGEVTKIYQYEDYKDLSDDALYELIKKDIYVNESTPSGPYKSRRRAEYLERAIYRCPKCGITHFKSHKNTLKCTTCDLEAEYTEYKQFKVLNGELPFNNVNEWYEYQIKELMNTSLLSLDPDEVLFEENVIFKQVIERKKKITLSKNAKFKMYPNHFEIEYDHNHQIYNFDDVISTGVFGKNKINFFIGSDIYQVKGDKQFNPLKYVNFFYKYKIEIGETKDNTFLGL